MGAAQRGLFRALAVVACLGGVAACAASPAESPIPSHAGSDPTSVTPSATPSALRATAPDDFYYPPSDRIELAAPGDIIDSVEILAPNGVRAWTVLYGSTGLDGEPVAVSGLVVAPTEPPADQDGYPVIAWAHGTTGIADPCAPSRNGLDAPIELVRSGYVVTLSDYEGLGTDGTHPYIIGISEGRSVLDSIRAAQKLAESHAGTAAVVAGLSQGGHAALWAGQLAPTYAPELDVRGALAGSPATDLSAFISWTVEEAANGNIGTTYAPMLLFGVWSEAYGLSLPFLTDEAQGIAATVTDGCDPEGLLDNPYASDPALLPEWAQRLRENSPGATQTDIPYLVVSPTDDQLVSYDSQVAGVQAMCAVGDTIELRSVTGGHDALVTSPEVWSDALAWIEDRFAGMSPTSTCGHD